MNQKLLLCLSQHLLKMVLIVLTVSILSFILLANSPIDPIDAYFANSNVSEAQHAIVASYWGFDKPPLERFILWGKHILHGDFGESFIYREPVIRVISEKAGASLLLMSVAWVLSGLIGFSLGIIAGVYRNSLLDQLIKGFSLLCLSVPLFWLGLLFLIIFSVELQWFPLALAAPIGKLSSNVTWADRLHHLILPALTLSITGISSITMQTREKMIEILDSHFILFARARGQSLWESVFRHGLRNILLPGITLQFASISELFGGSILAETVFSYPGLGNTVTIAGLRGDLSLLLGIAIFSALFIFAGNLIADILYGYIDPRIREGGRS